MNSQYKELSDKAFSCHQNGDLETAATIYAELLKINPDDANILNLSGLLMLATGNTAGAIDYITKAFIINPTGQIAGNLAKAYYSAGMYPKAVKLYLEALKMEESDDIYYSLGLAYKKSGDLDSAIEAYHNALEQNPGNYSSCYNLALAYSDKGDITSALFYAEKCAILRSDDEALFAVLSGLYEQTGDYEKAVSALEKAAEINPNNFSYFYNMAVLNAELNRTKKAIDCYFKAIAISPEHIETYVNLSNLVRDLKGDEQQNQEMALQIILQGYEFNPKDEILLLNLAQLYRDMYKNEDSIRIVNELLAINPANAQAYWIMALNCMDKCNYEAAFQCYDTALKLEPDNVNFIHGYSVALKYLDRIEESQKLLESIIDREDISEEAKRALGMIYLQNKDFEKGMKLYHNDVDDLKLKRNIGGKTWEFGDDLEGKSVVVYTNCGLGDTIMCARYLPLLKEKVKSLILQTDKDIAPIMQDSYPMINVILKSDETPQNDFVLQIMDIISALNMDLNNIPFADGYLKVNDKAVKMYSELPFFNTDKKKIGLFWQGNRKILKNRSIDFNILKQLTDNKDCNFYSFQLGEKIQETDNLIDLTPHIKDYSDTAALLKNIDILITIDSSIAHMAGALGVKTYLLLPKTAEWRWFYDDKTTPWYSSMTVFRQTESNNWNEVIDRVKKAL